MGLETVNKIADLNPLWPLGTDPKSQGDDHIRNIKKALQASDGGALTGIVVTVVTAAGAGTWTKQTGLKFLIVELYGGGGGVAASAAAAAGNCSVVGGAGSGGYVRKKYAAADLAATEAYTVGAGGAVGGAGVASTFKGLTAGGGAAGASIPAATTWAPAPGGAGGTATGGDVNVQGGSGGTGQRCVSSATQGWGGDGGSVGPYRAPNGRVSNIVAAGLPATDVLQAGSGASGGISVAGAAAAGAVGAKGLAIFTEIY